MESNHCSQTGKIYVMIIFCLILTSLLTATNVITNKDNDKTVLCTGIVINIIQTIYTLSLVNIDMFGDCSKSCKWSDISPLIKDSNKFQILKGYIYIPIILISSAYLLGVGLMTINESESESEGEKYILSIATIIIGTIGILFIFTDIICNIGCYCT